MSDPNLPPSGDLGPEQPHEENAPPPASRWRRFRWLLVGGSVLAVLLLLLLLAPTLLSTGWGRSLALSLVNRSLNGQIEVQDWSLGWWGGTHLTNVRVYHDGAQILQLRQFDSQASLMALLLGDYSTMGRTSLQGVDFLLKQYPDGTTNFQRLLGPRPPSQELPDVAGDFTADLQGIIEQQRQGAPSRIIAIEPSTAKIAMESINAPIRHQLDLAIRVGDGPTGRLLAEGTLDAFDNRQLNIDRLVADSTVEARSLELAGLLPLLGPDGPISELRGVTNARFIARVSGAHEIAVEGNGVSTNFAVGGRALRGDTYHADRLTIDVPRTTYDRASGRIRVGQGPASNAQPVSLQAGPATRPADSSALNALMLRTADGAIGFQADATLGSLQCLARNQAPGDEGQIAARIDLDLSTLSKQLPNLLQIKPGVQVESGRLTQTAEISLSSEKATLIQQTDLANLAGRDAQGQPIAIRPIHLRLNFASLGGGGSLPDIRDLALILNSGFATVHGTGESLAKLNVEGNIRLADAQRELGQFVAFGPVQVAGDTAFTITTSGDLTQPAGSALVRAVMTASDLQIHGIFPQPLNQPRIQVEATGTLHRGQQQFVETISNAAVTVQSALANASLQDGSVRLAGGSASPLQMLQKGRISFDVPDVGQLHALALTVTAPQTQPSGTPRTPQMPAGQDPGQVRLASGTAKGTVDLQQINQTLALTGRVDVHDLAFTWDQPQRRFTEPRVQLVHDIVLDHVQKTITVRNLALNTASIAAGVSLRGTIKDYERQRQLDGVAAVSYDAARLLGLLREVLGPEQDQLNGLSLAGVIRDRPFTISGTYPVLSAGAGRAQDPLRNVAIRGSLWFDRMAFEGMQTEQGLELPIDFSGGHLRTIYADRAGNDRFGKPTPFSGGSLRLNGLDIVLVANRVRATSLVPDLKVLDNVRVTPQFVDRFLGPIQPLFTGTRQARGSINLTIEELQRLPLDQSITRAGRSQAGRARFTVSLIDLALQSPMISILSSQLKLQPNADGTLPCSVRSAAFEIREGQVFSDMQLILGGQTIAFRDGRFLLRNKQIASLTMVVPTAMVPVLRDQKVLKDSLAVPVRGTFGRPQFDIPGAALSLVDPIKALDLFKEGSQQDDRDKKEKSRPPGTIGRPAPRDRQRP